jgi:integrase
VPRTEISPPDAATVRELIATAAAHDPAMACWLYVAVATGARPGEVCGLRWGDIDFLGRSVRIERSVSATRTSGVHVKPTKTGAVRRVSITAQTVEALHFHYERAERTAREHRHLVDAADFVFSNDPEAGRPWRPELATRGWAPGP